MSQMNFTNIIIKYMNEWYLSLRAHNLSKATEFKDTVDSSIIESENENLTVYYSLLEHWHGLVKNNYVGELKLELKKTLIYFYHFYQGKYKLLDKKFEDAIAHYERAKQLFVFVNDNITVAEHYFDIAEAYFEVSEFDESLGYLYQAMDLFNTEKNEYGSKIIECEVLIAKNLSSLNNLVAAREHLNKALNLTDSLQDKELKRKLVLSLDHLAITNNLYLMNR